MKHKLTIVVDGKELPCYQTMGALLRFKQETGKDVSEASNDVTDSSIFLWCCVAAACNREGIEFGLSLMDFADRIDIETMNAWTEAIENSTPESAGEQKKSL